MAALLSNAACAPVTEHFGPLRGADVASSAPSDAATTADAEARVASPDTADASNLAEADALEQAPADAVSLATIRDAGGPQDVTELAQMAAFDMEIEAVCPVSDDTKQVYRGSALTILQRADDDSRRALKVKESLLQFLHHHDEATWRGPVQHRISLLYNCLWFSLDRASPGQGSSEERRRLYNWYESRWYAGHLMRPPPPTTTIPPQATADEMWRNVRQELLDRFSKGSGLYW
jgi:hypothetical protein